MLCTSLLDVKPSTGTRPFPSSFFKYRRGKRTEPPPEDKEHRSTRYTRLKNRFFLFFFQRHQRDLRLRSLIFHISHSTAVLANSPSPQQPHNAQPTRRLTSVLFASGLGRPWPTVTSSGLSPTPHCQPREAGSPPLPLLAEVTRTAYV